MAVRIKHRVEYVALRLMAGVLRLLPHAAALAAAGGLAWFAFQVVRFRRGEALRRIDAVFGAALTPRDKRRIAWQSLRNLCFNIAELMRAGSFTPTWMARHVDNYAPCIARIRELVSAHGGLVLALPHFGNWDLAGIAAHQAGIRIFSVAGVQHNTLVNDWLNRQRSVGLDIIPRGSAALRQIVRRLREDQVFAILPDVRTRQPDLAIPFLGATANLGRGMAQFARVAGVPVLPVTVRRIGWFRHRFDVLEPLFPDKQAAAADDVWRITACVMTQIEAMIRADPGQWFWYNKRWVLEPLLTDTPDAAPEPAAGNGPRSRSLQDTP